MPKISHDPDLPRKEEYGNSDRLDPRDARRYIKDLVNYMKQRAWDEAQDEGTEIVQQQDGPSAQKQMYGDTWTFIYGISSGMVLMNQEHEKEFDWDTGDRIDHGIAGDDSWQEHYDEYGYGAYGHGLKIGKRLAFYKGRNFSFSSGGESETNFTIKPYDEG